MPKPHEIVAKTKFCTCCSQKLTATLAITAANLSMVFCCSCGVQLDDEGDCQNNLCKFYEHHPVCS
jgi:hypothetical protein